MFTTAVIRRYPVGATADVIRRSNVVIELCGYIIYAANLHFTSFIASGLFWDHARNVVGCYIAKNTD